MNNLPQTANKRLILCLFGLKWDIKQKLYGNSAVELLKYCNAPVFVCYLLLLFLQLSFSENWYDSSSEEKENVAVTQYKCYGKEVGFCRQPMEIAEASSRPSFRFIRNRLTD